MKRTKKDTNRIAKVNSLIQHQLGPILLRFLEGQKGLVTISKVETSGDMKWAKVWISILPTEPSSGLRPPSPKGRRKEDSSQTDENASIAPSLDQAILKHLNKNIYHIQGELNKSFATKVIPRLQFFLDTAPRYVEHIEELVREIHNEIEQN